MCFKYKHSLVVHVISRADMKKNVKYNYLTFNIVLNLVLDQIERPNVEIIRAPDNQQWYKYWYIIKRYFVY